MKLRETSFLLLLLSLLASSASGELTTAEQMNAYGAQNADRYEPFVLTGEVVSRLTGPRIILKDETGGVVIWYTDGASLPRRGERIRVTGKALLKAGRDCDVMTYVTKSEVLSSVAASPPSQPSVGDILTGRRDFSLVRVTGTVIDAFSDDIDPRWNFLLLRSDGETLVVAVPVGSRFAPPFDDLRDAEVSVCGVVMPTTSGCRRFAGPYLELESDAEIAVTVPPPHDPFAVRELGDFKHLAPRDIAMLGRRQVCGRVIAVWSGRRFMIDTGDAYLVLAETARSVRPPACGDFVKVVGYPTTDLINLKLTQAVHVSVATNFPTAVEAPRDCKVGDILGDAAGRRSVQPFLRGKLIRLRGIVRSVPLPAAADGRLVLQCGDELVTVFPGADVRSVAAAAVGATVDVTGVCLIESSNWSSGSVFPRLEGFSLVMRSSADLTVVHSAPWWTPVRLLAVIVVLLLALLAVYARNRFLKRLGKLKIAERTRLAMELHDSVSQNLTGIALQIDAAERLVGDRPSLALRHLSVASKTLVSCREELRNCIWDLRSRTLEERDLATAIRKTVQPHVEGVALSVRFPVPRTRLSDNAVHTLLRMVRELATNAVRHGRAKSLHIAGTLEADRLGFSVADDGCGFDPENRPGIAEGHFGLQGVAERVKEMNGELKIESAIGRGTKVSIWIRSEC